MERKTTLALLSYSFKILFLGVFCTVSFPALADPVKKETIEAFSLIEKGAFDKAEQKVAQSRDPLVAKVFYWQRYIKGDGEIDFRRLSNFIVQNPTWPKQQRLKAVAEEHMPEDLPVEQKLRWFNGYMPQTVRGMELNLSALLVVGKSDEAKKKLNKWWQTASLTKKEQTTFLKTYKSYFSKEAHKARFDHLLFKQRYTNARALSYNLGKGYLALAEARIALARNKGGVNALINRVPKSLRSDAGLAYERLRWRRRHDLDDRAIEILMNPPPVDKISNPQDWWRERHIITRRLIEKKQYEKAYKLVSVHQQKEGFARAQAEWVSGWLALRFVNQPHKAIQHFEVLFHAVSTPVSKARAAYWIARACDALKRPDMSRLWYIEAARYPMVYYGQKAQNHIAGDKTPVPRTYGVQTNLRDQLQFENQELLTVVSLLHYAGQDKEASALFRHLTANIKEDRDYKLLAEYASNLGRKHDALHIAKTAIRKGIDIKEAYPVAEKWIKEAAIKDSALVYGLIRQESMFNHQARSPAGALGLMQLMPSTARLVAKKNKIIYNKTRLTSDPAYNVRIGSLYIAELIERYNGSYPLAIAAYNGGPGRVDRWLKQFGDPRDKNAVENTQEKMIDFIESIPVYETRNYVQRVLEARDVYLKKIK